MPNLLPNYSTAISTKIAIDDSADGDGGRAHFAIPNSPNVTMATSLTIDSIANGRVRWSIGGQHGAWRSTPGTFTENITAADGPFARLEYDPYTVAVIDARSLSVVPL